MNIWPRSIRSRPHWGRFFVTGGHALVTQTPNVIPHLGFDPIKYAQEMIWTLKPGRQLTMADYGHNFHMLKYGFTISDKTAVGQSMLGHLWMIGGLAGVIMGGLGLGLLHGVLVLAIKRAWEHSMAMALILIAGVAYPLVWARGVNCISHWRFLVWFTAFSFVFLFFLPVGCRSVVPSYTPARYISRFTIPPAGNPNC